MSGPVGNINPNENMSGATWNINLTWNMPGPAGKERLEIRNEIKNGQINLKLKKNLNQNSVGI